MSAGNRRAYSGREGQPAVGFALVPDDALDGERRGGRDHAVEQRGRTPRRRIGAPHVIGRGPAGLLRLGILAPLRGQDRRHVGLLVHHPRARCKGRHQRRIRADGIQAEPGFHHRAAPGGVDQPDGHALPAGQLAAEEVGDGGEVGGGGGRTHSPGGVVIAQRILGGLLLHQQQPDVGLVRGGDLLGRAVDRRVGPAFQLDFHVRLARGEPHVAHQNVVERDGVRAGHRELVRAARGLRRKPDVPVSQAVRGGLAGDTVEGDGDLFVRRSPTPDVQRQISLHHHVAAEDSRQFDFAQGARRDARGQEGGNPRPKQIQSGHQIQDFTDGRGPGSSRRRGVGDTPRGVGARRRSGFAGALWNGPPGPRGTPPVPLPARRIKRLPLARSRSGGRLRTWGSAPQTAQMFGTGKSTWH